MRFQAEITVVDRKEEQSENSRYAAMINPAWAALFFLGGGAVLLALHVCVFLLTGASIASDRLFAAEAFVSGLGIIGFVRFRLHRRLVVAEQLKIPFVFLWALLCVYVFFVRPFQ